MMISIILPSYNESESIITTIDEIITVLEKSKISFELIVSDDNSPDLTWKLVKNHYSKDSRIKVLRRMKDKGLSLAVIDGFKKAKGDFLFVMDADGQHDPNILPKMVNSLKKSELVVASRYISGGGVGNWSKLRIFTSRFASLLAYPFMGSNKISDPMSGFFGINKTLFNESDIKTSGYKILLAIILSAKKKLKISEIPYTFRIRKAGESKLGIGVIFNYLFMLIKFFITKNQEFLKFGTVGALGTIVNLLFMYLSVEWLKLPLLLSSGLAVEISIFHNFILNNLWTFSKRNLDSLIFKRFLKFNFSSLVALAITMFSAWFFTNYLSIWYLFSQAIGILLGFTINFLFNHHWVFKNV